MTLNEYFDKIYCINLERRKDRKEQCISEFFKHNLNVEFISAIDGKDISDINVKIKKGAYACSLSHIKIYNDIIKNNYNKVLILEDDIEFSNNLTNEFNAVFNNIPENWNLLYFSGNHYKGLTKINNDISKMIGSLSMACYGITYNMTKALLNILNSDILLDREIDMIVADNMIHYNCYVFNKALGWQRENFSDIEGRHTNYTMLRHGR